MLPSHHHSNVIYQFVCHCGSRYIGCMSQHLEEWIKQLPSPLPILLLTQSQGPTYVHKNFMNPPLVNIFLTMPNALFTTVTTNFLFLLEVALLFTFLLLKQLSLNLLIPFCVNKKNSSTL